MNILIWMKAKYDYIIHQKKWRPTVEPVVLFYMLPLGMLLPCLQDLIYTKVCMDLYDWNVCNHLNEDYNKDALSTVQSHSIHWVQLSTILMAVPSMISGQLLGTFSDNMNRKLPLIGPPVGGVLASLVYVLVSNTSLNLHISWILLASFFTGLGGSFPACLNICATYLSQISSEVSRTSRVGVMECMTLVGFCFGPLITGALVERFPKDKVFTIILAVHAINIIYILGIVPNLTPINRVHSRLSPSERSNEEVLRPAWNRLKEMFGAVFKVRPQNRRLYLLLLFLSAAVIMICNVGQADVLYYYLKDEPLSWSLSQYTRYSALTSGLYLVSLLLVLVPLSYKLNDCFLLAVALLSKITGLIVLATATTDHAVYAGSFIGSGGSWCFPALRSMISKIVEVSELGRVFGMLGIIENCCTLLGTSIFTSLYPLLRETNTTRSLLWIMSAVALCLPFMLTLLLNKPISQLRNYSVMEDEEEDEASRVAASTSTPVSPITPSSLASVEFDYAAGQLPTNTERPSSPAGDEAAHGLRINGDDSSVTYLSDEGSALAR